MDLNGFFPLKVCINLDRRPDRWQRMRERLAALGLGPVERHPAVDGRLAPPPAGWAHPPGAFGCLLSHLEVVRRARREGMPRVLILEDDAVLHPEAGARFAAALPGLPPDWRMLFFGCIHETEPVRVSESLVRLTGSYSTYAYALDHTVYDAFIDLNERCLTQVDHNNFLLQARFPCYCFLPHLAWVEAGYSDAQGTEAGHWYLKESLVLKGAEAAEARRRASVVLACREGEPGWEYVPALAEHYLWCLPGIDVVAVEQSRTPRLSAASLPEGCRRQPLPDGGPFSARRCWDFGIRGAGPERDLFVLASPDLHVERPDLAASLLMALRHDTVIPYREVVGLTAEESRRLVRGEAVPLDGRRARPRPSRPGLSFRRGRARVPRGGSVFEAPARALRLRSTPDFQEEPP